MTFTEAELTELADRGHTHGQGRSAVIALAAALLEALRDARRYQWLRGNGCQTNRHYDVSRFNYGIGLDRIVDAAIAEGKAK